MIVIELNFRYFRMPVNQKPSPRGMAAHLDDLEPAEELGIRHGFRVSTDQPGHRPIPLTAPPRNLSKKDEGVRPQSHKPTRSYARYYVLGCEIVMGVCAGVRQVPVGRRACWRGSGQVSRRPTCSHVWTPLTRAKGPAYTHVAHKGHLLKPPPDVKDHFSEKHGLLGHY